MTRNSVANRFRTRKLSTKQSLQVLRENQIDLIDDDAQRNIPQIETGVERQEEIEHHLQAAINSAAAGAKDKKVVIPTPSTAELPPEEYLRLYPKSFKLPCSYIRFSSTVEDCNGTSYCMSEKDDEFLEELNKTRSQNGLPPVLEEEFETIMDAFEAAIQVKQPYLMTDPLKVSNYEGLEDLLDETLTTNLKPVSKLVYEHWRTLKIAREGRSIIPTLKFEQGNEKDDGDPYVCFRRREVRGVRKTRRTDAQSSEKLKRLRQELEIARGLVKDVLQREQMRKNLFEYERQIFEKRRAVIEVKRKLGIKGDDEDLINKPKRSRPEQAAPPALRIPIRQDGKPPEADLKQLATVQAEQQRAQNDRYQQLRRARHKPDLVDITEHVLSSSPTFDPQDRYCGVQAIYSQLPTPPSSNESVSPSPPSPTPEQSTHGKKRPYPYPAASSRVSIVRAPPRPNVPNYRRRIGRGGRTMIDRRAPRGFSIPEDIDEHVRDRFKYDDTDDSDSEHPTFKVDPHSEEQIKFRARMLSPPPEDPRIIEQRRRQMHALQQQQFLQQNQRQAIMGALPEQVQVRYIVEMYHALLKHGTTHPSDVFNALAARSTDPSKLASYQQTMEAALTKQYGTATPESKHLAFNNFIIRMTTMKNMALFRPVPGTTPMAWAYHPPPPGQQQAYVEKLGAAPPDMLKFIQQAQIYKEHQQKLLQHQEQQRQAAAAAAAAQQRPVPQQSPAVNHANVNHQPPQPPQAHQAAYPPIVVTAPQPSPVQQPQQLAQPQQQQS